MMKKWILAGTVLMAPVAAHAAGAGFAVGDVPMTVALPQGYCIPVGTDKLIADKLATGDAENLTLATLIRCDRTGRTEGPGNDYMLIKTPKAALGVQMPRAELLAALAAEYGQAEWQSGASSKKATAGAAQGLSDALGTPVEMTGEIAPRGTDSDCAYLGGSMNVSGGGVTYPIILGGCITSVGDKVVAVYTYDDPGKGGGVAGKMRTARNVAMSIKPRP